MSDGTGSTGGVNVMTKLDWHKNNIDTVIEETANDRRYRHIYAIAVAVGYILEWIRRQEKSGSGGTEL